MKIRSCQLLTLPSIFLLSFFSFVAQARAQQLYNLDVLHRFCSSANCADGAGPLGVLIRDAAGNLYGTTQQGGNFNSLCSFGNGCGVVFKVDNTGQETVLHAFCSEANCADGFYPEAGLIEDSAGNLYGTTAYGGAHGGGTVFKMDNSGQETVLHSFCSTGGAKCTDGSQPSAALIEDGAGNLYGTTTFGGAHGTGTVFKLDNSEETVLYDFCSLGGTKCTDGWGASGLIRDGSGNLYGTTQFGGNNAINPNGGGTAFKLDGTGHLTVLYSFCSESNCADGNIPYSGLIQDAEGNLYGTTSGGGATDEGAVFKLDSSGHETLVYSFCPEGDAYCEDGIGPRAGLIEDAAGNLFGTTSAGGLLSGGTVFRVESTGQETVLYNFCLDCGDGAEPAAGLIEDPAGVLYGTTSEGVSPNGTGVSSGTVFKLSPAAIIALTSSPNPSYADQSVTFSVVVSGSATGPTPSGSVTFSEGATALGMATLANGQASLPVKFQGKGSYYIIARYSGDVNYQATSSNIKQVVIPQNATSTTLASNLNPSTYGQAVTLTATVSSAGPTPTGTVIFKNVGRASLSGGVATLSVSALPVGSLAIIANYAGDTASKMSKSSPLTQVVNQATSTTAIASSVNPSMVKKTVKFTATVTSATTTPTGSVTFMDGSTALATRTLGKGSASYSTSALGAGAHNITAVYEGTSNIGGSTSPTLVQTVE